MTGLKLCHYSVKKRQRHGGVRIESDPTPQLARENSLLYVKQRNHNRSLVGQQESSRCQLRVEMLVQAVEDRRRGVVGGLSRGAPRGPSCDWLALLANGTRL